MTNSIVPIRRRRGLALAAAPTLLAALGLAGLPGCDKTETDTVAPVAPPAETAPTPETTPAEPEAFDYQTEQFADIRILRYRVPGFEALPLERKKQLYHLYEAALSGRDIIWDQNYRHNLAIRHTLEAVVKHHRASNGEENEEWDKFMTYTKRVWFSNGIHHHYSNKKFTPGFSKEFFAAQVKAVDPATLPLKAGETADDLIKALEGPIFDPKLDAKKVDLDPKADLIQASATNFYGPKVTQKAVEKFYKKKSKKGEKHPVSHGLNSQLVKGKKGLEERVWFAEGMYGDAIKVIARHLDKAAAFAENDAQKDALLKLVAYYQSGDLKDFDDYSIAWVADADSMVDVVNGFIEVYGDPMGYRGSFESVVSIRDVEASQRIDAISKEAQWFEDNSPIPDEYKKKSVKGISAKVINVVVEAGDAAPTTPIGINLPNSNWIRAEHGSKSVNLGNIVAAYDESARQSGRLQEFAPSPEHVERQKKFGELADKLHTDMHEVIGHASGQIKDGVGTPKETLKNYSSTLEEARADLVALYYLMDPKLIEIGVMSDLEVGKAAYDDYISNGLMVQLARLEPGEHLEEAHMRNRQTVAAWVYEKGKADKVIERVEKDGKTYFVVNDYDKLRTLFGDLLREIQRIKSEGDYAAGKKLVETYGVKVEPKLHEQVLARYAALDIAPYAGFIQPRLVPVMDGENLTDVKVEYPADFTNQMLEFGERYSLLPTEN